MDFICNVCGTPVTGCPIEMIDRELASCQGCGSTVRYRSIVHLTSLGLFGRSVPLTQFPNDPHIVGLGLSDWSGYAEPFSRKFRYTNTFFHKDPYLDIVCPGDDRTATCDFVISSDVFEHLKPPVSRAFTGAFNLLKPGGHLVLTVPFTNNVTTIEHFPELNNYQIVQFDQDYVLVNQTIDGRYTMHEHLVFHGGPGTVLEMRIFGRADLEGHLAEAGFIDTQFLADDVPQWGILHKQPWSLPILSRRPL